jgi:hypothetical protein
MASLGRFPMHAPLSNDCGTVIDVIVCVPCVAKFERLSAAACSTIG